MREHFAVVLEEKTYLFVRKLEQEITERWTVYAVNGKLFVNIVVSCDTRVTLRHACYLSKRIPGLKRE